MSKESELIKSVLEKIRTGGVSMRPKAYFMLLKAAAWSVAVFILAAAAFALSFVFFSVSESGEHFLLSFGQHGLAAFIALFPWHFALAFVIGVVVLEFLAWRFTAAYRFSMLRVFLWTLVIGIAASTVLGLTPLHSLLLARADQDDLPLLGALYEQIRYPHPEHGVYRGTVTSIGDASFVLSHDDGDHDSDDGSWTIVPPEGFDLGALVVGDQIYIGGRLVNDAVYAYGIQLLPPAADDR